MTTDIELLNKDFQEQEKKNREKYGPRGEDHIADCYKQSVEVGDTWTLENAKKYLKRFTSKSSKAKNPMDLLKVLDYVSRCYLHNKELGTFDKKGEIID